VRKESYTGTGLFLGGILLLLGLVALWGCEKATLGDGMPDGQAADDFHGAAWTARGKHGLQFMANTVSCDPCHGEELKGGISEVSCDVCHPGWEGDCTFCHGGMENDTGAPPFDVNGETERRLASVGAHSVHVEGTESHAAFGCDVCHGKDFVSYADEGHLEGGRTAARVTFSAASANGGRYDRGAATCSQLYCHGDGQTRSGMLSWVSDRPMGCDSCHGYGDNPQGMSGWHGLHLRLNQFGCEACHAPVVDGQGRFLDRALHINGQKDVGLDNGWYDASTKTCSTSCHETVAGWSQGYHPEGWAEAATHGYAFFADSDSCKNCHGVSLLGGDSGGSCDFCHTNDTPAWRTECTFCHGGMDNGTGAPPEGIYGETARASAAVGAHTAHVQDTAMHAAFDCTLCHDKPVSFDDQGHIDTVNGVEMQFAPLAGTGAAYNPSTARCASLYCHGDGRNPSGQVAWTVDLEMACNSCHGDRNDPQGLSGRHTSHLGEMGCEECHAAVVSPAGEVIDRALHVNGRPDVEFASGGSFDPGTMNCTTATGCHDGEIPWAGNYHADGWAEMTQHGFAFYDDPDGCKSCHGETLTGGTSGGSCDSCHTNDTPAWRTECTYCHGGIDNATGAPPEGVHGETSRASAAVGAHRAHVEDTAMHAAFDCTLCHDKPVSFDDQGHIDTVNGAEMQFAPLAGTGAAYNPSTARCASLYCHGDGRNPSGQVAWTVDLEMACNSCHGYTANPRVSSGRHEKHLEKNIRCSSCHAEVVDTSGTITNKQLHPNGARDISFSDGGIYDPSTLSCSSLASNCHKTERWR
jgi:predicted CxxxxCH...CXXCH cytochrome family protein